MKTAILSFCPNGTLLRLLFVVFLVFLFLCIIYLLRYFLEKEYTGEFMGYSDTKEKDSTQKSQSMRKISDNISSILFKISSARYADYENDLNCFQYQKEIIKQLAELDTFLKNMTNKDSKKYEPLIKASNNTLDTLYEMTNDSYMLTTFLNDKDTLVAFSQQLKQLNNELNNAVSEDKKTRYNNLRERVL